MDGAVQYSTWVPSRDGNCGQRQCKAFRCSLCKKSTWHSYLQHLGESAESWAATDEAVQVLVPGCIRWMVCHQVDGLIILITFVSSKEQYLYMYVVIHGSCIRQHLGIRLMHPSNMIFIEVCLRG